MQSIRSSARESRAPAIIRCTSVPGEGDRPAACTLVRRHTFIRAVQPEEIGEVCGGDRVKLDALFVTKKIRYQEDSLPRRKLARREVWSAPLLRAGGDASTSTGKVDYDVLPDRWVLRTPQARTRGAAAYRGRVHAEQMAEEMPLVDLDASALEAARLLADRRLPALVVTDPTGRRIRSCRLPRWCGSWCRATCRTTRRWPG